MEGNMFKKIGNAFYVSICAVLIIQLMGCGTIMYPERKGQKTGRIDSGVAILDGIGLLFFLIPGIIAYAVDFTNGTIYLPGTARGSLEKKNIREVKFDHKNASMASIDRIIKKETGCDVRLYQNNMTISELESIDDMMVKFAQNSSKMGANRVALIR